MDVIIIVSDSIFVILLKKSRLVYARQGKVGRVSEAKCLKGINYFLESFNLIITASHAGSRSNKNSWTAPQYLGPN